MLEDVFLVLKEREVLKSLRKSILQANASASAAESASVSNVCFGLLFSLVLIHAHLFL